MCLSCIENVFPKGTFGTLQGTILTTVNNKCYVLGAAGKQHASSEHSTHFIFCLVLYLLLRRLEALQESLHL
jgi:hypothetical protein